MLLQAEAEADPNVHTINSDHMAKKFLVKFRNSTKQLTSISGCLKIHPGGHYISKSNSTIYCLFDERYSEDSNTIVSQIHFMLKKLIKPNIKSINITLDNHSTNKNKYLMAYLDYLVRCVNVLGEAGKITLIFLVAGHSHNIIDQRHSVLRTAWAGSNELFSINDWVNLCNNYQSSNITAGNPPTLEAFDFHNMVYDFKGWLKKSISKNIPELGIKAGHIFQFTKHGLRTKEWADDTRFSIWRGTDQYRGASFEPFRIIIDKPNGFPKHLPPKKLTNGNVNFE